MKIFNNRSLIAGNAVLCESWFSRTKGLMFSGKLKHGQALVLKAGNESRIETAIHMMFVFFSIDVAWLDSKLRVVDLRKNIMPFTPLVIPREPARYVVELPKNSIRQINIGDRFYFL